MASARRISWRVGVELAILPTGGGGSLSTKGGPDSEGIAAAAAATAAAAVDIVRCCNGLLLRKEMAVRDSLVSPTSMPPATVRYTALLPRNFSLFSLSPISFGLLSMPLCVTN